MRRLIGVLIAVLIRLREREPSWVLPPVAVEEVQEWTADDRGELLRFLRSATGRALLTRLRYNEALLLANACDGSQRCVDHARGRAVGYRECAASLILLSAPGAEVTDVGGVGNDRAHNGRVEDFFAGEPERGAAALRNQLSHD